MVLSRRDFLTWSAVLAAGAVTGVGGACSAKPARQAAAPEPQELMKVGLYTWEEITYLPRQTEWLALAYARAGVMTDPLMTFCVEHTIDVLLNVSPAADRTTFGTDAEFVAAYVAQVDQALRRYGPKGTFWAENPGVRYRPITQLEVCNEPNFGYGFSGSPEEIVAVYAQVLIQTYGHIKSAWPEVTVVGFAAGGASNAAPDFISASFAALKAAGDLNCFDVVAFHPYTSNKPPEQTIVESWGSWSGQESIDAIQQIMLEHGINKPLWITEVGYQISQADGGMFAVTTLDSSGQPDTVTPAQQAAYTIRVNMAAARYDIPRVYHMFALDSDNYNGGWFGLAPANDPRPVAVAMRQVIQLLSGATYLEIVLDGSDDLAKPFAYRFTTPRGSVLVAWCQLPASYNLKLDAGTRTVVTDMLGNQIATTADTTYEAALSETPIFLHSTPA